MSLLKWNCLVLVQCAVHTCDYSLCTNKSWILDFMKNETMRKRKPILGLFAVLIAIHHGLCSFFKRRQQFRRYGLAYLQASSYCHKAERIHKLFTFSTFSKPKFVLCERSLSWVCVCVCEKKHPVNLKRANPRSKHFSTHFYGLNRLNLYVECNQIYIKLFPYPSQLMLSFID